MEVNISIIGKVTEDDSYELLNLAAMIERDSDYQVKPHRSKSEIGMKDGGLVIGLTIGNFVITTLSTLISILAYWQSTQPKYTISYEHDGKTFVVDNIALNDLGKIAMKIERDANLSELHIEIAKR